MSVPYLELHDGHRVPQLGFGVFQVPVEETAETVGRALDTGYRSIDTAAAYENEEGVRDAVQTSHLERGDLFITTKLFNDDHGRDQARKAFRKSLETLGGDYIDLYLIHWPAPARDRYVETWKAFCELQRDGRARSIGVSNFTVENLERIIDSSGVVPVLNQIELHPRLIQSELRRFHAQHEILTEAWSPIARGGDLLSESVLAEIAKTHERTPAQVVLRWHMQLGNVAIPRSVTPSRIKENFRIFDFSLSDEEMRAIEELDSGRRTGPDPETFG